MDAVEIHVDTQKFREIEHLDWLPRLKDEIKLQTNCDLTVYGDLVYVDSTVLKISGPSGSNHEAIQIFKRAVNADA